MKIKPCHSFFPFVQAEKRPGSNHGHFWHLGIPRRPPKTNLDFPLESRLRSGTKAILESCFRSRDRTVGGFHWIERSTCQRCSGKYLQKQVFFLQNYPFFNLFDRRCSEMKSWLQFDFDDLDSGYVYCCSVADALRTIKVKSK